MTYLKSTLGRLYKNITDDVNIVDTTVNILYPNMDSQSVWDTLVTDLRQICPNNEVAEEMSQSTNHDIYRLYLSNSAQNAALSAIHTWDSIALFGFKMFPYPSGDRDIQYQDKLRSILKNLAYGKVEDRWGTFPSETMEIGNGLPLSVVTSKKPQENICNVFKSLHMDIYGSQN